MADHQHVWVLVSQDADKFVYQCSVCGEIKVEHRN